MQTATRTTRRKTHQDISFSPHERMLMDSAAQLTVSDVSILREREYLTVEESQMLLLRMIDEEYGEL